MEKITTKYEKPLITAVVLDPEQAVLQVCAIGGVYLVYLENRCMVTGTIVTMSCPKSVRGRRYTADVASAGGWEATSGGS